MPMDEQKYAPIVEWMGGPFDGLRGRWCLPNPWAHFHVPTIRREIYALYILRDGRAHFEGYVEREPFDHPSLVG